MFSEAQYENNQHQNFARWRFLLQEIDGHEKFEVSDFDHETELNRLQLLTTIRGIEELDQSSEVNILTSSSYVDHGIRFGLPQWRQSEWQWERFGKLEPITNDDLWQRFDRAVSFHRISCQYWDRVQDHLDARNTARLLELNRPMTALNNRSKDSFARRFVDRFSRIAASVVSV